MRSMTSNQFELPKGYVVWCHICGKAPFDKMTAVEIEGQPGKYTTIAGLGFKTLLEAHDHEVKVHRVWKG